MATKKKKVQAFLEFGNDWRGFIINYSANACLLIDLTMDIAFTWGHTPQQAFDKLGARFFTATILTQFDRTFVTRMKTDASKQAIAGMLSPYDVVNRCKQLHPVEYYAKTLSSTQHH